MIRSRIRFRVLTGLLLVAGLAGCDKAGTGGKAATDGNATNAASGRQQFVDLGTAPPGAVFFQIGTAIAEVLEGKKGDNRWRVQAKGSAGTLENIRRLDSGEFQLAMSNAAISTLANDGKGTWDRAYPVRSVVTLAPNIGMFVTKSDSGIKTIADLKGKRVVIGPPSAGFEMFVLPILEEHGIAAGDITPLNADQGRASELLADGAADAAFLGGAVPNPAVQNACNSMDILFIPFDEAARDKLVAKYPFYGKATIPATTEREGKPEPTYKGMTADFEGLDVGRMHLITHEKVDEDLVYRLTKTLWENRAAVAELHPIGKLINEKNAARPNGVPFHPGAIRFYKEIGIFPEAGK